MKEVRGTAKFIKLFSGAVLNQALLSAGSFCVGLIFIRLTTDQQYGYYVLIISTLLLLTVIQNAYINPSMVQRLARFERSERGDLIGGLYREQRQHLLALTAVSAGIVGLLWYAGVVDGHLALVLSSGIVAALATLYREFFRMVLIAYRLPIQILRVDVIYILLLLGGAFFATHTAAPAMVGAVTLAFAATVGGLLFSFTMWRHESWNIKGYPGILVEIAPWGVWGVAGAGIHWTFTQGYSYLVAGTLDVTAVATLSATRLLMMPVNLMSTGVGSMMFPTVSKWLHDHPPKVVFRRLVLFSIGVACLALCYFAVMWLLRDWIFTNILKKQFAQRDTLLILWSMAFLLMTIRDQLIFLPVAAGRFRELAGLTLVTAILSLLVSYFCMLHFGLIGALLGILCGEAVNIICVARLSLREAGRSGTPVEVAQSAQ